MFWEIGSSPNQTHDEWLQKSSVPFEAEPIPDSTMVSPHSQQAGVRP
jgi:hypothetical protein